MDFMIPFKLTCFCRPELFHVHPHEVRLAQDVASDGWFLQYSFYCHGRAVRPSGTSPASAMPLPDHKPRYGPPAQRLSLRTDAKENDERIQMIKAKANVWRAQQRNARAGAVMYTSPEFKVAAEMQVSRLHNPVSMTYTSSGRWARLGSGRLQPAAGPVFFSSWRTAATQPWTRRRKRRLQRQASTEVEKISNKPLDNGSAVF